MEYELLHHEAVLEVWEKGAKYKIDLRERLLNFSVAVLKFLMGIPYRKEFDVIKYQLSKSATSIGANYEESQASTYNEFVQRLRICLRETNETLYWLKIIDSLSLGQPPARFNLLTEADEIGRILGAIVRNANQKRDEKK